MRTPSQYSHGAACDAKTGYSEDVIVGEELFLENALHFSPVKPDLVFLSRSVEAGTRTMTNLRVSVRSFCWVAGNVKVRLLFIKEGSY